MKEFRKYMHVERLGREEVDGVLNGPAMFFLRLMVLIVLFGWVMMEKFMLVQEDKSYL